MKSIAVIAIIVSVTAMGYLLLNNGSKTATTNNKTSKVLPIKIHANTSLAYQLPIDYYHSTTATVGRNFYVSQSGNDSNDGSINSPWQTIQFGLGKLTAGDTLSIRSGLYFINDNGLQFSSSGAANAPITIQSFPGEKAVIDGLGVPTGPEGLGSDTLRITGNYIMVKGLEFRNNASDGININGKHIRILNNTVHHSQNGGIRARYKAGTFPSADVTIDGNSIFRSSLANALTTHAADEGGVSDVQGNWWSAGIVINNASGVYIYNNLVYENYGEGIICYLVDKCQMKGNTVHDNFSASLYYDNVTNSTMEGNMVYSSGNTEFYRFKKPQDGIMVANEDYTKKGESLAADVNECKNNRIINNIVVGEGFNLGYGAYERGGGLKNTLVANNTFVNSGWIPIMIQEDPGHSNSQFINNIFYQPNGKTILTDYDYPYQGTPGITFHHNLWYGGSTTNVVAPGSGDVIGKNPNFQKAGSFRAEDYKLQSNSPARQSGVSLNTVISDFFGIQRPSQNVDMGAHQN